MRRKINEPYILLLVAVGLLTLLTLEAAVILGGGR
jgi:hypothetical protein